MSSDMVLMKERIYDFSIMSLQNHILLAPSYSEVSHKFSS
ncbi:3125_t:CDS:2 [Rhizophagus irregularis]|nr:3125_t:CDS:2 [Rhizophagus irregularis]